MAASSPGIGPKGSDEPPELRGGHGHDADRVDDAAQHSGAFAAPSPSPPPPIGSLKDAYDSLDDKSKPSLLLFVASRPLALQYFPDRMKNDYDIIQTAYEADPHALQFASTEAQHIHLIENPEAITYSTIAKEFMDSKIHVFHWLKKNHRIENIARISEYLLNDEDIAYEAVSLCEEALIFLSVTARVQIALRNPDIVFSEYFAQEVIMEELPSGWHDSVDHMRLAIRLDPGFYEICSDRLKEDRSICWEVTQRSTRLIRLLPTQFQIDYLSRNAHLILKVYRTYIPSFLLSIKSVALHVMTNTPNRYEEIDGPLKTDPDILKLAARDPANFRTFDEAVQLEMILETPHLLESSIWCYAQRTFPDELYASEACVALIVRYAPTLYVEHEGRGRRGIEEARALVKAEPNWINCLDFEEQETLLRESPTLFEFLQFDEEDPLGRLSPDLTASPELMTPLIMHHPECFSSLPETLRTDRVFVTECMEKQPALFNNISRDEPIMPFAMGLVVSKRDVINTHMIATEYKNRREFWFGLMFDVRNPKQAALMDILNRKSSNTPQIKTIGQAYATHRDCLKENLDLILSFPDHFVPLALHILLQTGEIEAVEEVRESILAIKGGVRRDYKNKGTGFQMSLANIVVLISPLDKAQFIETFRAILKKIVSDTNPADVVPFLTNIAMLQDIYPQNEVVDHIREYVGLEGTMTTIIARIREACGKLLSTIFGEGIDNLETLPTYKRSFDMLVRYAKAIEEDAPLHAMLNRFLGCALSDRFATERMNPEGNPNLQLLIERNRTFYDRWAELHGLELECAGQRVVVSGNWEDHFCTGAEVINSCQHPITHAKTHAKALMGYCMDGRDHLLVIHNPDGTIRARANLRFGFVGETPVLLLAQTLARSKHDKETLKGALLQAAQQIAARLEVPLFDHAHASYGIGNEVPLQPCDFEKGSAPYVYDDVLHKMREDKFTLSVLYDITELEP